MNKKSFFLLVFTMFFCTSVIWAQKDTSVTNNDQPKDSTEAVNNEHLRISLITCGPGYDEVYEVFGHTAIRIIDSVHQTDMVFNYGTFDGFADDFELKFMKGKLLYWLSTYPFQNFLPEYVERQRSVTEQVLLMSNKEKSIFAHYLQWNAEAENREYKYDFFYDNCSTRIRDLFPKTITKSFVYGPCLPKDSKITFRDIINQYFYTVPWERFGINILLGSRIDKVMSEKDIMFLPDYLSKSIEGATAHGVKIASAPETYLNGGPAKKAPIDGPLLLTLLIAALTIAGISVKKLSKLGKIMSISVLFITGLLGCLILVMWFGTNHGGCRENLNLLWALPTNIVIAFANPKGKGRYALVGIVFIMITLLLHLFRVQQVILSEFAPLFLALIFIYGNIYKKTLKKATTQNA